MAAARAAGRPAEGLEAFVPALARLVPEWGDAADDASALVLGEAVLRLLSSWGAPGTGVLVVLEDLQWADPESLAVLEYVVDNLAGAPVTVVGTLRDGEPGAGADVMADALARRVAFGLTLDPLSDDEVLAVARSCLDGGDLPGDAAAALVARSEGVPYLVEELLATAVRSGWHTISEGVPGSVVAAVATRLGRSAVTGPDDADRGSAARSPVRLDARRRRGRRAEVEAVEQLRLAIAAQLVDVGRFRFPFPSRPHPRRRLGRRRAVGAVGAGGASGRRAGGCRPGPGG